MIPDFVRSGLSALPAFPSAASAELLGFSVRLLRSDDLLFCAFSYIPFCDLASECAQDFSIDPSESCLIPLKALYGKARKKAVKSPSALNGKVVIVGVVVDF